jgi:hypothetical protein
MLHPQSPDAAIEIRDVEMSIHVSPVRLELAN